MNTKDLGDRLARDTLDLVRISSPSHHEAAAADWVETRLRAASTPDFLHRYPAALVAGFGFSENEAPDVVLGGHLDTVPEAGHPSPVLTGDQVAGLGTTDMKGALAVMLELASGRARERRSFALVFYDCEEVGFEHNGLRTLFEREAWLSRAGLALMLEPTDNHLELGCLGTIHAEVSFLGKAAHSARPWMGENAVQKAGPFLADLAAAKPREYRDGPALYREVLSATRAAGGKSRNVVPDRFTLTLNLRFPPDRTPEEAEAYLRSRIPPGTEVEIVDVAPAAPARMDHPLLAAWSGRRRIEPRAKQAWTDVAQFAARGIAAANFGPGIPELAHQLEERVPIANLVRAYEDLDDLLAGEEP